MREKKLTSMWGREGKHKKRVKEKVGLMGSECAWCCQQCLCLHQLSCFDFQCEWLQLDSSIGSVGTPSGSVGQV